VIIDAYKRIPREGNSYFRSLIMKPTIFKKPSHADKYKLYSFQRYLSKYTNSVTESSKDPLKR
jgi:hypothetical protein